MASPSKLARNGIISPANKDLIINLPSLPNNMILELLPLSEAAKMSVLSKTWRNNWSCLRSLVFDQDFWKGQCDEDRKLDWQNYSSVISNILCHHNGSIHEFHLDIPKDVTITIETFNLSPWICYLSRNDVKMITLILNTNLPFLHLPSHIFSCKNLEELVLNNFVMKSPSAEFEHFEHLRKLELISVHFNHSTIECLIAKSPKLVTLKLEKCYGVNHLAIDASRLVNLTLIGSFGSIALKNAPNLCRLELSLTATQSYAKLSLRVAEAIANLGTSCELESLTLGLNSLKLLAVGGLFRSLPLALTHLHELHLEDVVLDESFYVNLCAFGLIQSCPSVKELAISVVRSKNVNVQHKFDHDNNFELGHLLEVRFKGLTGSRAELKLIEYVLHLSVVLEKMIIVFGKLDDSSELKVQRELNGLRRASPKTQIIFQ